MELQGELFEDLDVKPTGALLDVTVIAADELLGRQPDPDLVRSIKRLGVLQPVWLTYGGPPDAHGQLPYRVIAGRSRIASAKYGLETAATEREVANCRFIPALVWPPDAVDVWDLALMENALRAENPLLDFVGLTNLREGGRDQKSITATTGMGKSTQEKRLKLAHLLPALYEALLDGKGAFSTYEAAAVLPHDQQAKLVQILESGKPKLTADDVKAAKLVVREEAGENIQLELSLPPTDWRTQCIQHVEAMLAIIPPDLLDPPTEAVTLGATIRSLRYKLAQ